MDPDTSLQFLALLALLVAWMVLSARLGAWVSSKLLSLGIQQVEMLSKVALDPVTILIARRVSLLLEQACRDRAVQVSGLQQAAGLPAVCSSVPEAAWLPSHE